jgi:hypothetical protein
MDGHSTVDVHEENHRLSRNSPNPDCGNARNLTFYVVRTENDYVARPQQDEDSIHLFTEQKLESQIMRWT